MGLRSWFRSRFQRAPRKPPADAAPVASTSSPASAQIPELAPGCPANEWEEIPAYLPVDAHEHLEACIIAAACAAGANPESSFTVKSVKQVNPEYRRVACIATALGAGALEKSSFTVRKIYRKQVMEEVHAA